jgi:hypothetical protein
MSKPISVAFEGEASGAVKAFDKVGDSSVAMSRKVNDSADSHTRLGERVGANEQKFAGTADLLDGLGGAFGLPTEGATKLMRGFSDLSGGFEVVSGILPALTSVFPKLAGAMTFVSAHPLMVAFLVGGAIILGLIVLEKKFGLVSDAVHGLGGVFSGLWGIIKPALNLILGGIEMWINAITTPMRLLSKLPGIPDLPTVRLPRLDVGGTVLQTGVAVVHRGEVVSPASPSSFGGAGGTSVTVIVNGNVTTEEDLVDAIHSGLLRKQNRTGSLGIAA